MRSTSAGEFCNDDPLVDGHRVDADSDDSEAVLVSPGSTDVLSGFCVRSTLVAPYSAISERDASSGDTCGRSDATGDARTVRCSTLMAGNEAPREMGATSALDDKGETDTDAAGNGMGGTDAGGIGCACVRAGCELVDTTASSRDASTRALANKLPAELLPAVCTYADAANMFSSCCAAPTTSVVRTSECWTCDRRRFTGEKRVMLSGT